MNSTSPTQIKIEGFVKLYDILQRHGKVLVEGVLLDAIVNAEVVQKNHRISVRDLTIDIDGDIIDMTHPGQDGVVYLNYREVQDKLFIRKFIEILEDLAIKLAKEEPESSWDYRLVK